MADFTALKTAIQNAIKQNGNEEITGNLLQDVLLAIVTTLGDSSINNLITALGSEATTRGNADTTLQQNINAEAQARQLGDSTLQGNINTVSAAITAINNAIGNGCVYAGIATPSSTPASGKVFYLALTAGTYTNYGGLEVSQGINILKNNGSTWSLDAFVGIDDAPTPSSNNLVKSGGVFNDIMTNGSAFDLTAYNNGTTYADLNAALTALNALPAAYKKGGMSMKYVQTSDNKYVQCRLTSNSFNTTVTNWIEDKPIVVNVNSLIGSNTAFSTNRLARTAVTHQSGLRYNGVILLYKLENVGWHAEQFTKDYDNTDAGWIYESGWKDITNHIDDVIDLSNSIAVSKNLLNKDACVTGGMDGDGIIGSQSYYKTSDYIRLKASEKVISNKNLVRLFEYDLNKCLILETIGNNVTSHTQQFDGYIRVSFETADIDTIQIEKGETVTEYTPYEKKLSNDIHLNTSHYKEIEDNMGGTVQEVKDIVTTNIGNPVTKDITNEVIFENGYGYDTTGTKVTGNYKCVRIDVTYKDVIVITSASYPIYGVIFDKDDNVVASTSYSNEVRCPLGSAYVYITFGSNTSVTKIEKTSNALENNAMEWFYGTNLLDMDAFKAGYSVNPTTGAESSWGNGGHTDFIPVNKGDIVILGDSISTVRYIRMIAAYNDIKELVPSAGLPDGATEYVVPDGVSYIILSIGNSNLKDDSRVNITTDGKLLKYEPYTKELLPIGAARLNRLEYDINNNPFKLMPNLLNSCCYKPLGVLSKPYICITSDDGYPEMATRSIPLAVQENIPITFYIMKGSPVLESSENIQTINDAIASGNCELGQHGYTAFINYTESQLNDYFDQEKEYWDTLNFEIKSSAPPTGNYNDIVNAVCGGRFGVNRNADADLSYGGSGCFANGPRSNIYALSSLGIKGHSLDTNKLYLDAACENNWLSVIHYHDFELDMIPSGETTMTLYEMLEELITYAKSKGMTFIKASEIKTII